jgi:hypothetical protein
LPSIWDYQLGEEKGGQVAKRKVERMERFMSSVLEEMEPGQKPTGEMGWDWIPIRDAKGVMKNYRIIPTDEWTPEIADRMKKLELPPAREMTDEELKAEYKRTGN